MLKLIHIYIIIFKKNWGGGGGAALPPSPKLATSQVHSLVRWVVTVIFEKLKCSHVLGRPTSGLVAGTSTVKLAVADHHKN